MKLCVVVELCELLVLGILFLFVNSIDLLYVSKGFTEVFPSFTTSEQERLHRLLIQVVHVFLSHIYESHVIVISGFQIIEPNTFLF